MEKSREDKIQDILNFIRFDKYGIEEEISKNEDLFEPDNGENEYLDESQWDEEYISSNYVWLRKNFSKKRLEHLIEVRNHVRGEVKKPEIPKNTYYFNENVHNQREENSEYGMHGYASEYNRRNAHNQKEGNSGYGMHGYASAHKEEEKSKSREDKIQDILNFIRFDKYGIEEEISKNEDLFEPDNGENEYLDESQWDEEYIASNYVWLRKNFSKKRLEHLIEVRNHVRGKIEKPEIPEESSQDRQFNNKNIGGEDNFNRNPDLTSKKPRKVPGYGSNKFEDKEEKSWFERVKDGFIGLFKNKDAIEKTKEMKGPKKKKLK